MQIIAGRFKKEDFYVANGFSRQSIYKKRKSRFKQEVTESFIIAKVKKIRVKHRRMGSRVMYYRLNIKNIGVNKFEKIVSKNGLTLKIKKRRIITTNGCYETSDVNLINGLILTNINQVVSGDITYLILNNKTYYIFTLKDMFSKRIVGLHGSDNMLAVNAVITLKQALKLRGKGLENCIHHSDAGSQYKSKAYKDILRKNNIQMSIAENCLQNGMAEQLNGVLKNDYIEKEITNVRDLNKQLTRIKKLINEQRPVKELKYKTPVEFEKWIHNPGNLKSIELYDFTKQAVGTLQRHKQQKSLLL